MRKPLLIETERLNIRSWDLNDIEHYKVLSLDIGFNCFAPPGFYLVKNKEEALQKIQTRIENYETKGLGKFLVFERDTGELIGACGIDPYTIHGKPEVELGYRLLLKHWGKGYAFEAARAMIEYGLNGLNLPAIYAFAVPQNRGSIQVLKKLGMERIGALEHAGIPHELFKTV